MLIAAAALGAGATAAAATALGQSGGTTPTGTTTTTTTTAAPADVCHVHTPRLKCPDLIMRTPFDRYFQRTSTGRILYHAGNTLLNIGPGPNELFGTRTAPGLMSVSQHIFAYTGARFTYPTRGRLVYKHVPIFGNYWKYENAAQFEIWTVDFQGHPIRRVRTGPKVIYCLRDLFKRFYTVNSPRLRHYPACNQNPSQRFITLGNSVGWSDDYPASYPEQYIDVTGLTGRFYFYMRADPLNNVRENNEGNNASPPVFLRLPPGRVSSTTQSSGAGTY